MIRSTITSTMLALGFLAFSGLSANAAPVVRHHAMKTAIVAQAEPTAPATDAPKAAKKDKKDKKAKSEKSEKSDKGDKKINVTREKGKAKGAATEAAPTTTPVPEKAQ